MSSTIESLKISASSKKPKLEHIDIMGKVGKTTSLSELPKNYNQAYYARNFEKKSLNLFQILEMIYCKLFISVKKVGRSSCEKSRVHQKESCHFIWHTNQRCCTILCPATKGFPEVFSVDLIFKLGDFYVTVILFRNPILINKEGTHSSYFPRTKYFRHTNIFWASWKEYMDLQSQFLSSYYPFFGSCC